MSALFHQHWPTTQSAQPLVLSTAAVVSAPVTCFTSAGVSREQVSVAAPLAGGAVTSAAAVCSAWGVASAPADAGAPAVAAAPPPHAPSVITAPNASVTRVLVATASSSRVIAGDA